MLPDLLTRGLSLAICGTGVGARSAVVGQYYAGAGNRFWRTLAEVGLIPEQLAPDHYEHLLSFGIGLTDLVKAEAGADRSLRFTRADALMLRSNLMQYQPWYCCFNRKRAANEFLGIADGHYGVQRTRVGRTVLFVAPSTSAAANGSWDLSVWQDLAERVRRPRHVKRHQAKSLAGRRPG
jgi:TDG/mug DNA glycosylase family protein